MSARVFYQLRVAPAIHRREIDQQGSPVPVFRHSRSPESVLRTVRRQQKRKRFGGQRIGVGASRAVFLVLFARCPAIHFPDFAHDCCFTRSLTAISFDAQLRFDGPRESLPANYGVDGLTVDVSMQMTFFARL